MIDEKQEQGSSLYYGCLCLKPDVKSVILALHAFSREMHAVVIGCQDPMVARKKLNWWREEIARFYQHQASHPLMQTLKTSTQLQHAPEQYFQDMIDGAEMDLDIYHYPAFRELELYCQRTAGALYVLKAHVLGFSQDSTLEFAKKLGMAIQLICIMRDTGKHLQQGRSYIAADNIPQYAIRAERIYQEALNFLPKEDRIKQKSNLVLGRIYHQLLQEMKQDDFIIRQECVTLTPIRKLWIAWRTL